MLRACGTLALLGLGAMSADLPVVEGDSLPHTFIPRLVDLWRSGELPLEKLVTRFEFDAFGDAWAAAKDRRVVKSVALIGR